MLRYFVAIDGGGTKTDAVLFNHFGRVINLVKGKSTNPNALSIEELKDNFLDIFTQLFTKEKPPIIASCFAGISGADHSTLNQRIKAVIQETISIPCERVQIENDAMNALWSGTDGKPGVVVIAGTGSIAYGLRGDGSSFRIGGWGHLVGDDGSGYYIGKEAVRFALRVHDGIEAPSPLYERLQSHFHISSMPDIIPIVYGSNKTVLSGLARVVMESASVGDTAAIRILHDSADFLAELIETALSHFGMDDVPVVLTGGLWHSELIRKKATERFRNTFIIPELPPVYGSMVGALISEKNKTEILADLKGFFKSK